MATIKDIAKGAGVTHSVVSRVLTGDSTLRVTDETRERVLRISQELNYTPNVAARALRGSRSRTIAMAVHDVINPVYAEIVAGAQSAANEADYLLLLGDVNMLAQSKERFNRLVKGGAIEGLILQGVGVEADALLKQQCEKENIPVVLLQEDAGAHFSAVQLPDEDASRIATDHLLNLGHRNIGFLGTSFSASFSRRRAIGWRSALNERGIKTSERSIAWSGSDIQSGYDGIIRLLDQNNSLTAVVVANVVAATGAISALHKKGVRIPKDLSIVSLHDTPFAAHVNPPLTCVRMPLFALGEEAVKMLLSSGSGGERSVVISEPKPELVLRKSTNRVS